MFDYFRIIFAIEALINLISGLGFILFPFDSLKIIVQIKETNQIQDLLCRWWGVMVIMQAGLLICGAIKENIRIYVYISLLIGEVLLIPVMIHYVIMVYDRNFFKSKEILFIATLIGFIIVRVCYFVLNSQKLA